MLVTICDDTWNMLNMQHKTPNWKRWDYSEIPGGGHIKIKGPAHMVEGGNHLRKAPNPEKGKFNPKLYILQSKHDKICCILAVFVTNLCLNILIMVKISLCATYILMLVITWTQYEKNPCGTVDVTERILQNVCILSGFAGPLLPPWINF